MDEREFRQLLDLFPVVRSRDYCVVEQRNAQKTLSRKDNEGKASGEDAFLCRLRLVADREMGPTKADEFCEAFRRVYYEVVRSGISLNAAQKFLDRV